MKTVSVLTSAAFPAQERRKRDLSDLFGTWERDEGRRFDKDVQEAFGKVDAADRIVTIGPWKKASVCREATVHSL